jgi:hypothetical protein
MRKVGWRLGWARLVCHFLGHDFDVKGYVKGSYELHCMRCDFIGHI